MARLKIYDYSAFEVTLLFLLQCISLVQCFNKPGEVVHQYSKSKYNYNNPDQNNVICKHDCTVSLVESIPMNLTYPATAPHHMTTHDAILNLIHSARAKIEIASFYWTLQRKDVKPNDDSANEGQEVFDALLAAGRDRNVSIVVVKDQSDTKTDDTAILTSKGGARVVKLDMSKYFGSGVLHTKLWIVDRLHFYVGSANFDWRSYTQVKELGVAVSNCSCMAGDMGKLFDVYWYLSQPHAHIPNPWPASFSTHYNRHHPASVAYNGLPATSYISSSPAEFCATGRSVDIDAIVDVIRSSQKFVYIAVMDYFPSTLYLKHNRYWSVIDDELRRAMFDRGVTVRLLASRWKHTYPSMYQFLSSLSAINGTGSGSISVKLFEVPAYTKIQQHIPFTRVNHNKYMVTEKTAYIGTSNWAGDYFIDTAGIGFIVNQPRNATSSKRSMRQQVEDVFVRDWTSPYSTPVSLSCGSLSGIIHFIQNHPTYSITRHIIESNKTM